MDMLSFKIEITEDRIKTGKKHVKFLTGLIILMIAVMAYDFYEMHINMTNYGLLIGLGMIIANFFWIGSDILTVICDLSSDKHFLKHLNEMTSRKEYVEALEHLKQSERLHAGATEQMNDYLRVNASRENMASASESQAVER